MEELEVDWSETEEKEQQTKPNCRDVAIQNIPNYQEIDVQTKPDYQEAVVQTHGEATAAETTGTELGGVKSQGVVQCVNIKICISHTITKIHIPIHLLKFLLGYQVTRAMNFE